MRKTGLFAIVLAALAVVAQAQWAPANPVTSARKETDGMVFTMEHGTLKVLVCTDSIIHVLYSARDSSAKRTEFAITKNDWPGGQWTMQSDDKNFTLTTTQLKIAVSRGDGAITYRDLQSKQLVQEASRKLTPVKVNGEDTYRAESFISIYGSHEAL